MYSICFLQLQNDLNKCLFYLQNVDKVLLASDTFIPFFSLASSFTAARSLLRFLSSGAVVIVEDMLNAAATGANHSR